MLKKLRDIQNEHKDTVLNKYIHRVIFSEGFKKKVKFGLLAEVRGEGSDGG